MADSDSSLSSPPSTDDEMAKVVAPIKAPKATPQKKKKTGTILSFFKSPSPVRKKRPASPPHEMVPEDNPDIAFIVMFRSRFADVFPPKTPSLGPQDLERGVAEGLPSPQIETLLCSLLALLLNRKKPIEKGHYGRALEEAIQTHRSQWPREWGGANPLSGNRSFNTMSPTERITLLKNLVLWSLHDSESVNTLIKETYKVRTTKDKNDTNILLSVQPWGRDGDNRRYWLIEGRDDTPFRVYRESNPKLQKITWWSVAGSIDEIRTLAQKLEDEDGTKDAKQLSEKMRNAIPRFEATEDKRKRREYRLNRQAAFVRPDPGFSLYEGRTRGKRARYTFSDEEEEDNSDALGTRRSNRQSGRDTPAAGPTVTASGRQVKRPVTGAYGESLLSGQTTDMASPATGDYVRSDGSEGPQAAYGRATRATVNGTNRQNGHHKSRNVDTYDSEMEDEEEATSWDGGDENDDEPDQMDVDDDDLSERSEDKDEGRSLVVRLRYPKGAFDPSSSDDVVADAQDQAAPLLRAVPVASTPVVDAIPMTGPFHPHAHQVLPPVAQHLWQPLPNVLPPNPFQEPTPPGTTLPLSPIKSQYAVSAPAAVPSQYEAHPPSFQTTLPPPTPASSFQ